MTSPRSLRLGGLLLLVPPGITNAQTVPPAAATSPVVTLSPFEVSTEKDVGYAASHSLAGGRISTELIRTPADVTVLTREFLNEIGALDYQDAAPYLTSMAQTDPVVTTDFGNKFTVRGLPVGLQMRNYFRVARPVDGYITERLEGLRGPNSLLFGDGALGGGLNTMTKRARPGRDAGEIVLRGDSEGSWYAAADLNRSLGPRTALRANTFGQRARYWIDRKTDDRYGVHLAALHRPWANAEVRVEGEYNHSSTNYPPPFFRDTQSNYTSGYRVTGPLAVASPAAGVNRIATETLIWSPGQSGRVFNAVNFGRTSGSNLALAPALRAVVPNLPLVRPSFSNQPVNGDGDIRHYLVGAVLEQQVTRRLTAEFAVQYVNIARHARNVKWDNAFIDPNAVLPDGTPNPKAGQPYDEKAWRWYLQDTQHFDLRAALAWQVPVTRWEQRVSLFLFRRDETTDFETFQIGRSNNPANRLLNATVNEPLFRIYWDEPAPRFTLPPADATYAWETLRTTDQRVRNITNSAQAATVASIWEDRISVIGGLRFDDYEQRQRDGAARDAAGRFTSRTTQGVKARPLTSSVGFVFFPIRPVGLYANHAETFSPVASGGRGLRGEFFGPTRADSLSGGLRFRLWGDQVVGSLGAYASEEKGRLLQYQSAAINRIWTNLNRGDRQVEAALGNYRDSLDYAARGVELDLTANLGRNFRLRGNVARPRTKQTNTVPGLRAYFAQYSAEWRAGAADPANPNRAQIATDIASLETTMSNANEGRVLNNTPDYTASVFGMYSLAAGPLKGLRLGGGLVWQGPRIIGNQLNRAFDYIRSDSYRTANLSVGYTLRVGRRPIELQFNVTNLFDHADPIYSGTQTFGGQALRALHYYLDPRKAALAATSRF